MDEKKKAQYEKKLASLQKKYDKKQQQYTGLQARYKKTKADLDAKWRKYYQQVKTVRASYKQKVALAELEKKIRKNYGKLLGSYLKKNWQIVREHSDVAFISSVLDANLTALSGADSTSRIHLDGQEFKLGDLQKQYQYATDPALRADMLVQNLLKDINPDLAERWAQWLEQRYGE